MPPTPEPNPNPADTPADQAHWLRVLRARHDAGQPTDWAGWGAQVRGLAGLAAAVDPVHRPFHRPLDGRSHHAEGAHGSGPRVAADAASRRTGVKEHA